MIRGLLAGTCCLCIAAQLYAQTKPDYVVCGLNSVQRIYFTTSSNLDESCDGRKALDADRNSCWISRPSNGPHWIEIDFGVKRLMSRIIVHAGKKNGRDTTKHFFLQFKYDNAWFDFRKGVLAEDHTIRLLNRFSVSYTSRSERVEIDLGGIDASTFRIFVPEGATRDGTAAIAEIEVYIGSNKIRYFDERLLRLIMPVKNGLLPDHDSGYPNSPRAYRGGTHAGFDIYHYHSGDTYQLRSVNRETPVLAADSGIVIRADLDYVPMNPVEWKNQSAYYRTHPGTFIRRSFGGRQVWIDHENGIITAYNHLSRIEKGIKVGTRLSRGEIIGHAGNSGLLGEAENKDYGVHLHFEIWVDGNYLGHGMTVADVRKYLSRIFAPGR